MYVNNKGELKKALLIAGLTALLGTAVQHLTNWALDEFKDLVKKDKKNNKTGSKKNEKTEKNNVN